MCMSGRVAEPILLELPEPGLWPTLDMHRTERRKEQKCRMSAVNPLSLLSDPSTCEGSQLHTPADNQAVPVEVSLADGSLVSFF